MLSVFALVIAGGIASAMIWQHSRYLDARRKLAHDPQPIWHSSGVFHALVFVTTAPGTSLLEELRALKRATAGSDARWIYAGKAVVAGRRSSQIGDKDWSAVALLQYAVHVDLGEAGARRLHPGKQHLAPRACEDGVHRGSVPVELMLLA